MENKGMGLFHSPEEKMVAVLGKAFHQKYMNNGVVDKGFAVMSDKRLYLRGKCYNTIEGKSGAGRYHKTNREKDIEVKDVISMDFEEGSGTLWIVLSLVVLLLAPVVCYLAFLVLEDRLIDYVSQTGNASTKYINEYVNSRVRIMIILLAVVFVSLLIYCAYMYIKSSKAYITIQYVGGGTAFLQKWYTDDEVEEFENLLHQIRDGATARSNMAVASRPETIPIQKASVADEISKLNELLAQGILSQEEFDKAKKELLGL